MAPGRTRNTKSESDAFRTPPNRTKAENSSSSSDSENFLNVTSKSAQMSPLAKDLLRSQLADSDANSSSETNHPTSPSRPALKRCPCLGSSEGKAWLLKCISCGQAWHSTCANLKGRLAKSVIDQLDHWQCPWCFKSPYEPPKQHKSVLAAKTLSTSVISDGLITKIEESIASAVTSANTDLVESIKSDLDRLSEEIKEFCQSRAQPNTRIEDSTLAGSEQQQQQQPPVESIKLEMEIPQVKPYTSYTENFITTEEAQALSSFLDQEDFQVEGSRKVVAYGEQYHYKGSSSSVKPIPRELSCLVRKIQEHRGIVYDLNQILVNKYETASNLPPHSDNEGSIKPDSSIFTVSLGSPGEIEFTHQQTDDKEKLTVRPNSLYEMSRDAQNYHKHQVLTNASDQTRYSITMRCVHWTYYNSTYAVGDSNFGHIEFGSGLGKVGKATPGTKDWAACVKDINPLRSASYRNIVVMSGTNDLKNNNNDVLNTYQTLKGKIEQIRDVNPHAKIFVCPVLPSRDLSLNQRINKFNWYIFHDLQQSNIKVNIVHGFNEFAEHGILKSTLHDRRTPTDILHINRKGYSILVKLIKQAIFHAKKSKTRPTTGRLFSSLFSPR